MTKSLILSTCLSLVILGCADESIPTPTNEISEALATFKAPVNLTATQGGCRTVTLHWDGVNRAYQYYIYSSPTPTSDFEICGETKGSVCSYTVQVNPGEIRYFKIRAVKYDETLSPFSKAVMGSSLAVPSITYIENNADNASATVSWWMKNCSNSTYKENVKYDVRCYSSTKTEILQEICVDGDTDTVTFENLQPATTYYYQVSAYVTNDQSKEEESELVDSTTAHRLIPMPAENVRADHGCSRDFINVSWELPDFVEVLADDGSYERHPVYFTVSRRPKDSSDEWTVVCAYAGVMNSCAGVTVEPYDGEDKIVTNIEEYKNYIPKSTMTFRDEAEPVNGKQYEYKVQSYVDDSEEAVTSEKLSSAYAEGWLCPVPSIEVKAEYTENEDGSRYEKIRIYFNVAVKDFADGTDYLYVLEKTRNDFETGIPSAVESMEFNSVIDINNYILEISGNDLDDESGYYTYRLTVKNGEDNSEILSVEASGKITVTSNKSLMPEITDFSIADGYADRFVLSWKYDKDCVYSLNWKDYDSDENEISSGNYVLTAGDVSGAEDGQIFTFSHGAASGVRRLYTLSANKGLEVSELYDSKVSSLGTAVVRKSTVAYDSISVEFEKVLKADSYELEAQYSDSEKITYASEQLEVSETEVSGKTVYRYTLNQPEGYRNAAKSGKPVTVRIKAMNEQTSDVTTGSAVTHTLGPALTEPSISGFREKEINLKWNEVSDAKGYLVLRTKYSYSESDRNWYSKKSGCESYFITASQSAPTVKLSSGDSCSAEVSYESGTYTLKDIYAPQTDETSSYQLNQANIITGLPYGYAVIPVLKADDFERTSIDEDFNIGKKVEVTCSSFTYENVSEVVGSTYGYGLNVRAAKCEDRDSVTVTWDKPYKAENAASLYKRPAGSTENNWTRVAANIYAGSTSAGDKLSASEKYSAFEYAVVYNKTKDTVSIDESFAEDAAGSGLAHIEDDSKYNYQGVEPEKRNKGYLMAVPFNARYGGSGNSKRYSETVEWSEWDFDHKSIGPSGYTLYVRNYNISADWVKVASVSRNGTVDKKESLADLTLTDNGCSLNLEVKGIAAGTSGTTDGMLKVLRDAKHYYKLVARCTDSEGETTCEAEMGGEGDVYAYRQITDEELIKATTLVLAEIINKSQIVGSYGTGKSFGTEAQVIGATGTFQWGSDTGSNLVWQLVNYTHYYSQTPGNVTMNSFIKLEDANTGKANRGCKYSGTLRHISACDKNNASFFGTPGFKLTGLIPITVTAIDIPLESYSGVVGISSSNSEFSATVKRNGTQTFATGTISGSENVKKWCPVDLDGNGFNGQSSKYGWWPNSN